MIKNYLITALRNIIRHKLYSLIKIVGLAVGLTCVIFVLLFTRDELCYDKWISGIQNLYRVEKTSYLLGRDPFAAARIPFLMSATMHDEIPEVTAMTCLTYNYMTRERMIWNLEFRNHIGPAFATDNTLKGS